MKKLEVGKTYKLKHDSRQQGKNSSIVIERGTLVICDKDLGEVPGGSHYYSVHVDEYDNLYSIFSAEDLTEADDESIMMPDMIEELMEEIGKEDEQSTKKTSPE